MTQEVEFTQGELAFLNSRGEDTAALEKEYSGGDAGAGDGTGNGSAAQETVTQEGQDGAVAANGHDGGEDTGIDETGSTRSQYVPHGQFHKERTKRHAAEQEAAELKLKWARAEERLAVLNEFLQSNGKQQDESAKASQQQQKSAWEEDDIDPEEDFAGAMKQLRRRQKEDRDARGEWQKKNEAHTRDDEQSRAYARDAIAYAQKNPAFKDAYKHLVSGYDNELKALGVTDPQQRQARIVQEERRIARTAFEKGLSPAQVIMDISQARGFVIPSQEISGGNTAGEEKHGEAALQTLPEGAKGKVESIKRAAKSTASLSDSGGGAKNELTMDSILAMDDDEFFAKVHSLPANKRKRLLAG